MIIKNGRVHTGTGEILSGQDILVENGKISAVGTNLSGKGHETFDAAGLEVYPGFIDAVDYAGCIDMAFSAKDYNELSDPITPHLDIKDSVDPDELTRQELFQSGITSIGVSPGNYDLIGGQMCVMKTEGRNVNKMIVRQKVAVKGSVLDLVRKFYGGRGVAPASKMGMICMLRAALDKAKASAPSGDFLEDLKNEVLKKVLDRKIPLIMTADTQADIETLIEALKEYDVSLVISNAFQAGQAGEAILQSGIPLILGEATFFSMDYNYEVDYEKILELGRAGILIGLSLLADEDIRGRECYFWTVSRLMKAGADAEEVLRMMTLNPAKILGVSDVIGSIEVGKDADFAIFQDDPIRHCGAKLVKTIIRGIPVGGDKC